MTTITFKTAAEWGEWARGLGLKSRADLQAATKLGDVATGRGKILLEWLEALEQGAAKGWTKDQSTDHYVKHLAKSGRGVSRRTIYNWWRDYDVAQDIAALVDERCLHHLLQHVAAEKSELAAKAAALARALQDAGVHWEMTFNGITVRGTGGAGGAGAGKA